MIVGQACVKIPRALACKGPAPPNPTKAKSLGSNPCSTETKRRAPNMASLAILMIPSAASSTDIPIASATFFTAATAALLSIAIAPPS